MKFERNSNALSAINSSSVVDGATDQHKTIVSLKKTFSPFYKITMQPDEENNHSNIYCRICHEDDSSEELIDPCDCTGSLGLIHASCLQKWLSTSNTDHCEICKHTFVFEKKEKPLCKSCHLWWKSKSGYGPQGIMGDVICLLVLIPSCIFITYLCVVGTYTNRRLVFWEFIGLSMLFSIPSTLFFLWLIITVRFHYKSWMIWRKRNLDIKLIVKEKSEMGNKKAYLITIDDKDDDTTIRNSNNNNNNNNNNRFMWPIPINYYESPFYSIPLTYQMTFV
ncbi:hypothetical protein M0802_006817 [Mischocyttarus mexicanus]|nr:hypothetical protein M0802_006817 [Mischocyttarus mexicanus]